MNLGMYIHIPFCSSKCSYCDFLSFEKMEYFIGQYIGALVLELTQKSFKYKNQLFDTIYIGGGTPSFIDYIYIEKILDCIFFNYNIYESVEITIEINPKSVDENKLKAYKKVGINRLSLGLQSTSDEVLSIIERSHTYADFLDTYDMARKIGYNNISTDLMIGLPKQNIQNTINEIIKINPEHISIYSLILHENTPIWSKIKNGNLKLPNEIEERKMYWYAKEFLEQHDYIHYEISNFAKQNYFSNHNLKYWNQEEYIGFGLGASSYYNNIRYSNTNNLKDYCNCMNRHRWRPVF